MILREIFYKNRLLMRWFIIIIGLGIVDIEVNIKNLNFSPFSKEKLLDQLVDLTIGKDGIQLTEYFHVL